MARKDNNEEKTTAAIVAAKNNSIQNLIDEIQKNKDRLSQLRDTKIAERDALELELETKRSEIEKELEEIEAAISQISPEQTRSNKSKSKRRSAERGSGLGYGGNRFSLKVATAAAIQALGGGNSDEIPIRMMEDGYTHRAASDESFAKSVYVTGIHGLMNDDYIRKTDEKRDGKSIYQLTAQGKAWLKGEISAVEKAEKQLAKA